MDPPSDNTTEHTHQLAPRDSSYTVYPSDLHNSTQIVESEKFLWSTYGKDNVKVNRNQDGPVSWSVHLTEDHTVDSLREYSGIRLGDAEAPEPSSDASKRSDLQARGTTVYIVTVADPDDESRTKEIRQFLDSKSSGEIAKFHRRRKVVGWGGVELDAAAKAEVQAYEGVEAVFYAPDATLHLLSGESETRSGRFSRSLPKYPAPVKRASTWKKQTDAPKNLVMLGQPPDTKLDGLTDYVYPEYSGEGVYIYVIDTGVQIDVKNRLPEPDNLEFKTEDRKVLRTELSKKHDSDASTDPVGHGTIAASIAAGKQYGVAKGATVIPVKVMPGMNDAFEGLELVFEDIEDNDRFSKSVVLLTRGFSEKITHDNCPQDWRKAWVGYMNDFFNEGVPLVVSAGNTEKGYSEPQKLPMDTAPQVLEDKDTPLINVGAATLAGEHSKSSRAGTQLTVYAPGDPVKAQGRTDGGFVVATGTSEAAPAVAGLIATYLSYDTVPWDPTKSERARVQAIKEYISQDKSSLVRGSDEDVRVIWNGADKDAHKSVGANSCGTSNKKRQDCSDIPQPSSTSTPSSTPIPSSTPVPSSTPTPSETPVRPTCYGFGPDGNKYIDRAHILQIVDTFCSDAAAQGVLDTNSGSISRKYNPGSPEEIAMAMDWQPGLDFKPEEQKCKDLMTEITDSCDTNDSHWKGGGEKMDGEVTYHWGVMNTRSAIGDGKAWGGCEGSTTWFATKFTIWGSKFAGDDFGKAILDGISGKGVSPTKWEFDYGGGDDHREWTATVNTVYGAEYAVEPVVEGIGSIDIECN